MLVKVAAVPDINSQPKSAWALLSALLLFLFLTATVGSFWAAASPLSQNPPKSSSSSPSAGSSGSSGSSRSSSLCRLLVLAFLYPSPLRAVLTIRGKGRRLAVGNSANLGGAVLVPVASAQARAHDYVVPFMHILNELHRSEKTLEVLWQTL